MNITKTLTETYTLRGEHGLWAKINLDCGEKSVNVMISSDYGEFNYYWGSTGYIPKKFLCRLDMHYAMKKLMGSTQNMYEPDFPSRIKSVNKQIIEARRESEITKDQARNAWNEAIEIFEYCGNSNDIYYSRFMESDKFNNIFYDWESIPEDDKLKPKVKMFWDNIWLPFTRELRKEYAQHYCKPCGSEYVAKPNSTCNECGFVGVEITFDKERVKK